MLERMHELMLEELRQTARTDTIYSSVAIALNLLVLAVSSAIGGDLDRNSSFSGWFSFAAFLVLIGISSYVTLGTLRRGQSIRQKLLSGLLRMYQDNGLHTYYDPSILEDSNARYRQYTLFVVSTAAIAILVPLLVAVS